MRLPAEKTASKCAWHQDAGEGYGAEHAARCGSCSFPGGCWSFQPVAGPVEQAVISHPNSFKRVPGSAQGSSSPAGRARLCCSGCTSAQQLPAHPHQQPVCSQAEEWHPTSGHRQAVLLRICDEACAGVEVPLAPGGNDLDVGLQAVVAARCASVSWGAVTTETET